MMLKLNWMGLVSVSMLVLAVTVAADEDVNSAESEVRETVTAFNRVYEANDLDAYFGYYLPGSSMRFNTDLVMISDYESDWRKMIAEGGGVELCTFADLHVVMSPDNNTAVASYVGEVHTRAPDGTVAREVFQESDTWFKVDGNWRLAHLHYATQPQQP